MLDWVEDASGKTPVAMEWLTQKIDLYINTLEMRAVPLPLLAFQDWIIGQSLVLVTDASVVAYLHKQGGTNSSSLCLPTQQIVIMIEFLAVEISARYIMSKQNIVANQLSHKDQVIPIEWSLFPWFFSELF